VEKGSVSIALHPGTLSTFLTVDVGYRGNQSGDSTVSTGDNATIGTVNTDGGTTSIHNDVTTINQNAGVVTLLDASTVTTWNVNGGTAQYESNGTGTTVNVGAALLDFRRDRRSRTITNCTIGTNGSIFDPSASVTWTNDVILDQTSLPEVTLDLGTGYTFTPTPI
jgi:hypothetical protein